MHTEHLQNVRVKIVLAGFLVAIAVTSLVVLALVGFDIMGGSDSFGGFWSVVAVVIGFWAGGFFAGFRALQAAVLHGAAIGITALVAWFVLNVVVNLAFPRVTWRDLTPMLTVGLLVAMLAAAILGALLGYNLALRGKPGLSEHEPV